MTDSTRIILVRHGQTEWNKAERFRGRVEIPLDEIGLRQAAAAAAWLRREYSPVAVYSSPLARAVQTAAAIGAEFGLQVETLPELTDLDFGQWEGLAISDAAARYPELFHLWREEPHRLKLPGGESLDEARDRALAALSLVVARHPGQTSVIVTHRVICKVMLNAIMGLDNSRFWLIDQASTAINVFDVLDAEKSRYIVRTVNQTCHLWSLSQDR